MMHPSSFGLLVVAATLVDILPPCLSAPSIPLNPEAVAGVKNGTKSEAHASWWGFGPVDSTESLQAAINSGAKKLIIENMGVPWIVARPLQLVGDQEIVFEKGAVVEAKQDAFHGKNDSLFLATRIKNLKLTGPGAILRMHKEDYQGSAYTKAEWRNGITLFGCGNVEISGLTIASTGGDGIYLGAASRGTACHDIAIRDVQCLDNHRQGISVISAENLLIERCLFKGTRGTGPAAGIDFEPNSPDERLVNCVMRDCVSEDNAGVGFQIFLPKFTSVTVPLSIRLERCRSRNCSRGVTFTSGNTAATAVSGTVEFVDCRWEGDKHSGIEISAKPAEGGADLRFQKCAVINSATLDAKSAPVVFSTRPRNTANMGGVTFEDFTIEDSVDRHPLLFRNSINGLKLSALHGTLLLQKSGKTQSVELTDALLEAWFPAGKR